MAHPFSSSTSTYGALSGGGATTATTGGASRLTTAEERLTALRALNEALDRFTTTSEVLELLAAATQGPVPFGARTPEVAREAAELVTRRQATSFRNAPFTGADITSEAEELRLTQAIKAKADNFSDLAAQAVAGCSGKLGGKLRDVVKVVSAGLMDPFNEDRKSLQADSEAMRSHIEAYNASIQASKATLGALRGENSDLLSEVERLRSENDELRAATAPQAPRPAALSRAPLQPSAARRGRSRRR